MTAAFWVALGLGVLAGGALAVIILKKLHHSEKPEQFKAHTVDNLVKDQYVCDALDMGNVISWFKDNAGIVKGEAVYFLAKPTAYTAELFAITGDIRQLDSNSNLIQVVVDREKNLPAAIRLISFASMPELIAEKMKSTDYLMIFDE